MISRVRFIVCLCGVYTVLLSCRMADHGYRAEMEDEHNRALNQLIINTIMEDERLSVDEIVKYKTVANLKIFFESSEYIGASDLIGESSESEKYLLKAGGGEVEVYR